MNFIVKEQSLKVHNNQSVQWVEYDPAAYSHILFSEYGIDKPSHLERWVCKRQAQFLAGRLAARNSLPESYKNQLIGIGNYREPLWPNGVMGSISHDQNISIGLSQIKASGGVGIDLQSIIVASEGHKYSELILTHSDQKFYQENKSKLSDEQLLTLIFSAKECFFKGVFNQVGKYFDFKAVSIKSLNSQAQKITLMTDVQLSENILPDRDYVIDYLWINNKVMALLNYNKLSSNDTAERID